MSVHGLAVMHALPALRRGVPSEISPRWTATRLPPLTPRPEAVTPSAANGDVGLRMTNVSHDATVRWVPAVHELSRLRETSWQPALVWHTSPARHARRSRPKSAGMHVVAPKCGFDRAGRPRGRAAPPSCRSVCHHVDDRPSPTLASHSPVFCHRALSRKYDVTRGLSSLNIAMDVTGSLRRCSHTGQSKSMPTNGRQPGRPSRSRRSASLIGDQDRTVPAGQSAVRVWCSRQPSSVSTRL
jgi:hypothetical protein